MISLRHNFSKSQIVGLSGAAALGLALAGAAGLQHLTSQSSAQDVFDPSTVDICSANTLCDNTQIKIGMHDVNGRISVQSPIGHTLMELSEKHTGGKVTQGDVVDLMSRFEGILTHAMPMPTAVAVNGMVLFKPPQNPGVKARYGVHAFIQDGETGCAVYEIKADGRPVPAVIPSHVGSHAAPVKGACQQRIADFSRIVVNQFNPQV